MPIRVVDNVGRVGRIQSPLSTLGASFGGTHIAPVARIGSIGAALGPLVGSMQGVFARNSGRTGVLGTPIGTLGGALRGTFVPAGNLINVSNVTQLMNAIDAANNAGGNRIISIADGLYALPDTLFINVPNVTLRGASGNRANVILRNGKPNGSTAVSANPNTWADSIVQFNVRVAAAFFAAYGITFAGWCNSSCIQFVGEQAANDGLLSNCIVQDSYQHLVKGSTDNVTPGPARGIVEDTLLRFTAGGAPAQYNGGIDVHKGANWIIRRNLFQDISSPISNPCQHAVGMWNGCTGTLIERNKAIDCDRGFGSGLKADVNAGGNTVPAAANSGDIIRNNMVSHAANGDPGADVAFSVENSINAKVYNNTAYLATSIINWALEARFNTPGCEFTNNLSNRQILMRDGGTATLSNNVTTAQASWFVDVSTGDLRLASAIAGVANAGANLTAVTDDFLGTARPQSSAPEIGAFEIIVITNPRQLPRLVASNFTLQGFILAPNVTQLEYGGAGLALSADGASMYMGKQDETDNPYLCRFSIPAFGGTGTMLTAPRLVPGSISPTNLSELGGALIAPNGKLVVGKFARYDGGGTTNANLAIGNADITGFTSFRAMTNLPTKNFAGQYLGNIPQEWQALFGNKPCFAGSATTSIITQCANGPTAFAFDPADIGVTTPIPSVPLMYYTYDHPLVAGRHPPANDIWSWADFPTCGMAMIDGTRTAVYVSRHGYGPPTYKSHTADPCDPDGGGEQAYPYRYQLTLWDMADFADVVAGIKQPWELQPYAWLPMPGISDDCGMFVYGGIAWDRVRSILWVVPRYGGSSKRIYGIKITLA